MPRVHQEKTRRPIVNAIRKTDRNPDKAAEILQSSWRRPRGDHVQSSSQQHDSASLQQPAPQSITSDVYSILKRYSDSIDPIERALRGQIVGIVREHEARYPRPPSHALMPRRHTRVQSKEISDELVAYTVPPIVRLPSTARHNPRSRTKGHAPAQVAKTSNVFERMPSRPQRSWPSRIPRPVRNPSLRMHSPTRLNPHTPTSEARTALIGNAFANIAPAMEALVHRHPRRQHPLPYITARYAGPAFNASPPPSALPVPAFARRIVPTASAVSLLCIADGRTTTSLRVGEGGSGGLEGQIRRPEPEPSAEIRSVERASEANVIKTRNREVMDRISLQRASSIPVAPRETDTPTATGAINTEVAPNESETPTTPKPLETPTPPQDIMPQPSSRRTTPIASVPSQVMQNNPNATTRPDTTRPRTDQLLVPALTLTNETLRDPLIPITRPLWMDQTNREFEASRPIHSCIGC
jgi:hypothetical protein